MPDKSPFKIPTDISIIVPAAPITKLALRGGGAKGAAYPGALMALEKLGKLQQIDTIAGSSAGSMLAAFLALGFSPDEIEKLSNNMDFRKFLDVSTKNNIANRGICDGNILYETFKQLIKDKIEQHIAYLLVLVATETLSPIQQDLTARKLKRIRNKAVSFSDLEYLNNLYKKYTGQSVLKDLIITGTNITDNKLAIFSAKSTPSMEIATAIRISTSYPIIFKAVTYHGKQYMDGGAMDNLPVRTLHAFSNAKDFKFLSESSQRQTTLSFMLGKERSHNILYHQNETQQTGIRATVKMYLSNLVLKINVLGNYAEMHQALHDDYGLRTIVLPTENITTLSFNITDKQKEDLRKSSHVAIEEYFESRAKEGVHYHEKDLMSCLLQITSGQNNPDIYKYIAEPILAANPGVTSTEKANIYHYVKAATDQVFELIIQKKNAAKRLMGEVKDLIAKIAELRELNELKEDILEQPAFKLLKLEREKKIANSIKQVQQLYTQYLEITDVQTKQLSTNPRHKEILNERLHSQQVIFNELADSLDYYNTIGGPVKKSAPEHYTDGVKLINSLNYFQVQRKKSEVIKILVESKVKYFQRSANIKLLSKVIQGVRVAKTFGDIEKEINKIKTHYKPRTFLSISSPALFKTGVKLDKAIEKERAQEDETTRLQSDNSIAATQNFLNPIQSLLENHALHLQKKLLQDFKYLQKRSKSQILGKLLKELEQRLNKKDWGGSAADNQEKIFMLISKINENYCNPWGKKDVLTKNIERHKVQLNTVNAGLLTILMGEDVNSQATPFERLDAFKNYFSRPEVQATMIQYGEGIFSGMAVRPKKNIVTQKIGKLLTQYNQYKTTVLKSADNFDGGWRVSKKL